MKFPQLGLLISLVVTPNLIAAIELKSKSADGIQLAGTLHVPEGSDSFHVVIFTHGSEPGQRSQHGYLRWAEPFVNKGIGVLVFDKRGCGESEGKYIEAPDLIAPAEDLISWVNLLDEREDVETIGVLGWSQGGWVGPLAASKSDKIHFIVAISGSGVSPLEQNIYDKSNQFASTGANSDQIKAFKHTIRTVWYYLVTGDNRVEAEDAWSLISENDWFKSAYNGPPMMDRDIVLRDPRMTSFVAHSIFEPVPVLKTLTIPMLAVFGEDDTVVPVELSISEMRRAFKNTRGELTIRVVPKADHGLRNNDGNLVDGYPGAVIDWVLETLSESSD